MILLGGYRALFERGNLSLCGNGVHGSEHSLFRLPAVALVLRLRQANRPGLNPVILPGVCRFRSWLSAIPGLRPVRTAIAT